MFNFLAHIHRQRIFVPVQQGYCCIFFLAYELYPICYVEDCGIHYRLGTDIPRLSRCQQPKTLVGFNASFAILKKGIKSRANIF